MPIPDPLSTPPGEGREIAEKHLNNVTKAITDFLEGVEKIYPLNPDTDLPCASGNHSYQQIINGIKDIPTFFCLRCGRTKVLRG